MKHNINRFKQQLQKNKEKLELLKEKNGYIITIKGKPFFVTIDNLIEKGVISQKEEDCQFHVQILRNQLVKEIPLLKRILKRLHK